MDIIITSQSVTTALGTRVEHDNTRQGIESATREARELDARKRAAAAARAQKAGIDRPLTAEEIRTSSHSRESWPIGVRIAVENAERALQSNRPEWAALYLEAAAEGERAKLKINGYRDSHGRIQAGIDLADSLAKEYRERSQFLSEVKPAQPEAPAVPAWIERHREEIRSDWRLTESQKRRRLEAMDTVERQEQGKLDAETDRKAKYDRADYTAALMDATLSVRIAELATDLPEEFVRGTRDRLEHLKASADETTYFAETALAEQNAKTFREAKKAERKAELEAAEKAVAEAKAGLAATEPQQ